MNMEELKDARTFPQVISDFFSWCGQDAQFCTWGSLDLVELQRNMSFYRMENPLPYPLFYYDVQKLFSLLYEDGKTRRSLKDAVEFLGIRKEAPFHRAFEDTYYTAEIMGLMDWDRVKEYRSVDYFRLPETRNDEIHILFQKPAHMGIRFIFQPLLQVRLVVVKALAGVGASNLNVRDSRQHHHQMA